MALRLLRAVGGDAARRVRWGVLLAGSEVLHKAAARSKSKGEGVR